jgi:Flp pilus assembly protein TadG
MGRPAVHLLNLAIKRFRVRLPESAAARLRARAGRRGQSLTEFALTLPVVLLIVLFGLDFGRVFLGWVTLTNAAREAANFAAMNPTAWGTSPSVTLQAEYARLVSAETAGANCTMPNPVPDPTFPNGKSLGSPASVQITCTFHLITPVIGNILGNLVSVSASSAYPVRSGIIEGIPTPSPTATSSATATPTPTPSNTSSPTPTPTPSPSPTATPAITPSPTPVPQCNVPNMKNINTSVAQAKWTSAGFAAGSLVFSPLVGPGNNYSIKDQSQTVGSKIDCTSSMVVYDKVQH